LTTSVGEPAAKVLSGRPKDAPSNAGKSAVEPPVEKLAAFLPVFTAPGFEFGSWSPMTEVAPKAFTLGFYISSAPASALVKSCYDNGWVRRDFDWLAWKRTDEAVGFFESPAAVADATADQLSKLLTVIIRRERFCDGALANAFESGLIIAILRRAAVLAAVAPA
jgi:hypothetical protein